jgi:hypothetical protein
MTKYRNTKLNTITYGIEDKLVRLSHHVFE